MVKDIQKAIEEGGCLLCGRKRFIDTKVSGVKQCKKCNAIQGRCYKGNSYELVLPYMANEVTPEIEERKIYYDLDVLGSDGLTRRHGWYDPETKLIVQVG